MRINLNNKLIKNHSKKSCLGKAYFLINYKFKYMLYYKLENVPNKTKRWLFRRLAKCRLVCNYRSVFIDYINNNIKDFNFYIKDPLFLFFNKFSFLQLTSLVYYKLTDYHIELIRRLAKKIFGKRVYINILIKATFIILKRTNQVRMGGGKGSKFFAKIYFIYPGCNIIEVRGVSSRLVNVFNLKLKKKMSFKFNLNLLNRI
jgi:ribosomal protein L16/L10AE